MQSAERKLSSVAEARELIVFSIPLFLSYLLQALYGSVDTIIVGQCASLGDIAGVTQGSQVMHILTQAISGISTGAVILIARYRGAGREEELRQTMQTVFSLFFYAALVLTGVMLLGNRGIIRLIELDAAAVRPMLNYLAVCELGLLFIFLYNCISAVLQAMGDSRHPLIFVGIACVLNVLLDLLFVAVLKMGAGGAALATVLAQIVSVVLSVRFLRRQNFMFDFRIRSLAISREKLRLLLKLGIPYAVQRAIVSTSFLAISGLSNGFGLAEGSASGVVGKINNFATMPFSAMQTAVTTMAGKSLGAGQVDKAKRSLRIGLCICLAAGTVLFTIVQLFPQQCLAVFSSDGDILRVGVTFLRMYSIEYLLMPFTFSINAFLSATGHTWMPMINGLIASLILRVPLAKLFSLFMGFPGISLGSSAAVLGAIISCCIFYYSGLWKRSFEKTD